jgi:hypothetical protein
MIQDTVKSYMLNSSFRQRPCSNPTPNRHRKDSSYQWGQEGHF